MLSSRLEAALVGFFCLLAASIATAANSELAARVHKLQQTGSLELQGVRIATGGLIADFYAQRDFAPAFDAKATRDVLDGIDNMYSHGLDPEDYHRDVLHKLTERQLSAGEQADLELLLMDAFLRMATHRAYGKIDPSTLDANWNFEQPLVTTDPLAELQRAMASGSPVRHLDSLLHDADFYHKLMAALKRYRDLEAKGGWPKIESGPALKPGMTDPRIPRVRERLAVTGERTTGGTADPELFDDELTRAVGRFQKRHGLEADGVIGPSTLAAMNMSVGERIEQIRVNLERARWVQRDLPADFVLVNIAGFRVYLVRNNDVAWSSRVQVGKTYRKTPVFRDAIRYVELNPTWTVPPGILRKDIIPQARKDPSSIRRKGLKVLDKSGREVNPHSVNWSAKSFPYTVRQDPGPDNALGRVKLMFPNKHLVYLHDTPSKNLFDRSRRTTSSGCIRVENPFDLTERVLAGTPGWDRASIDQAVASKRTKRVNLARPLPVLILYWTSEVMDNGKVAFHEDVYDRDATVLRSLNRKLAFSPPKRPERVAPPTKQAAPARPTASAGEWVVQVASLSSADGAQRLSEDLKGQGYTAFVTQTEVNGKTYHRVRLGPLPTREKANNLAEALRQKTGHKGQALRR